MFSSCGFFFLLSFFFFSSPNLSRRTLDVYHTSTYGNALVRIQNTGLKCAVRGSLKIQDAKIAKNSPSGHHHTTLSGCIFATKAYSDNRKKMLNNNISSTCPHNMANFGPLSAEIGSGVCQLISTGFASWQRYCTALQQWASAKLCGVEQRAPLYIPQGGHHVGHWPIFQFTMHFCIFVLQQLRFRNIKQSTLRSGVFIFALFPVTLSKNLMRQRGRNEWNVRPVNTDGAATWRRGSKIKLSSKYTNKQNSSSAKF